MIELTKNEFIEAYMTMTYAQMSSEWGVTKQQISDAAKSLGLRKKPGPQKEEGIIITDRIVE